MNFVHHVLDLAGHIGDHALRPAMFVHRHNRRLLNVVLGGDRAVSNGVEKSNDRRTLIGLSRQHEKQNELRAGEKAADAVREDEVEVLA